LLKSPCRLPLAIYQSMAIAAFFYQIKETDGVEIDNIARHLGDLDEINDTVKLGYTFSLSSLIGNINTERFYTYRGLHNIFNP
jgi:carbonic anhydrase